MTHEPNGFVMLLAMLAHRPQAPEKMTSVSNYC
jgi:hypothetical protein